MIRNTLKRAVLTPLTSQTAALSTTNTTMSPSATPSNGSTLNGDTANGNATNGKTPEDKKPKSPKKLALFFDGTGNQFSGNGSDTNIVKLYNMCDRAKERQFHYYQPGIGTYVPGSTGPINPGKIGMALRKVSQGLDQGFGSTFDSHVIAGYRFLMRYYKPGAYIYIFGFSRGAFTARFLASMITHVGLLSKGNEELIPFAYERYMQAVDKSTPKVLGEPTDMEIFKTTFCRRDVSIKFLGLFDSVHSVALFDLAGVGDLPGDLLIAENIRHAVALDECRTKFKPALLNTTSTRKETGIKPKELDEILQERWFIGNHGDIGGGWDPMYYYESDKKHQAQAEKEEVVVYEKISVNEGHTDRFKPVTKWAPRWNAWFATGPKTMTLKKGMKAPIYEPEYQMSDIALNWMLEEMDKCLGPKDGKGDENLCFRKPQGPRETKPPHKTEPSQEQVILEDKRVTKQEFMENMRPGNKFYQQAIEAFRHNCLAWNGGPKKRKVIFWWVLELLPFLKHMELEGMEVWVPRYTPNCASQRDLPDRAVLHPSVIYVQPDGSLDKVDRVEQKGFYKAIKNTIKYEQDHASEIEAYERERQQAAQDKMVKPAKKAWWKRALWALPALVVLPVTVLFGSRAEEGHQRLD